MSGVHSVEPHDLAGSMDDHRQSSAELSEVPATGMAHDHGHFHRTSRMRDGVIVQ
jgi:hypothetical protein